MFPMLGPPRPPKQKKPKKSVRLANPNPSPSGLLASPRRAPDPDPDPEAEPLTQPDPHPEPAHPSSSAPSPNPLSQTPPLTSLPSPAEQTPTNQQPRSKPNSPHSTQPVLSPPEETLIVISFITRAPPSTNNGQGTEILFYKPKSTLANQAGQPTHSCLRKLQRPPQGPSRWTFLFIDAGLQQSVTADVLSQRSINRHLSPPDDRLVKVRTSKPLRWAPHTLLVSVLYRVYDREGGGAKDEEWIKMGVEGHYWSKLSGFHSAIENDLVSTALAAVYFPVAFNIGFQEIVQLDPSARSDSVTLKVLETLYLCVQAGYARDGFKFYPKSAQPLKKAGNLDRDFKRRIWAYWTEVFCWHLGICQPTHRVSIMYTINKILARLKPAVRDDQVNVETLEKLMVEAIGAEADRCRGAVDCIVDHAMAALLNGSHLLPGKDPQPTLHLFTLGSSSATYGLLMQLVKHFITQSRLGLKPSHQHPINVFMVTIAESRPFHEGIILASKLNELIMLHERPPRQPKKAAPPPKRMASLGSLDSRLEFEDWYLDKKHQKVLDELGCQTHFKPGPVEFEADEKAVHGRLNDLLDRIDEALGGQGTNRLEESKTKVLIQVTTDVGFRSCFLSAENGILVLAADRILANGDAVCKLGSVSAAYTSFSIGRPVLVLVRLDRIEATTTDPGSYRASMTGVHPSVAKSLAENWKTLFKSSMVDEVCKKVCVGGSAGGWEVVQAQHVTAYVTDAGLLGRGRVKELAETTETVEKLLWEDDSDEQIGVGS